MTDALKATIAGYLRLKQLLNDIGDAQFKPGRTPVPREDTTERSKGMTSDPTLSAVADGRRLELRAAVVKAEFALETATTAMDLAEREVAQAYEKWLGHA